MQPYALLTVYNTFSSHFFNIAQFLPRDAMYKRGLCCHAVPVCSVAVRLSVCLSRSWIMSKRINISSKLFHRRVATPF